MLAIAMSKYEDFLAKLRSSGFNNSGLHHLAQEHVATEKPIEYAFQIIVENQRGLKIFGIPCFNRKSLIPGLDPPPFQRVDGTRVILSDDSIENYPLPDLNWRWAWDSWYVLMLNDVDESGWMYLSAIFRKGLHWHGKCLLGNFVRRRLWLRLRTRDIPIDNVGHSIKSSTSHQESLTNIPPPTIPIVHAATFV